MEAIESEKRNVGNEVDWLPKSAVIEESTYHASNRSPPPFTFDSSSSLGGVSRPEGRPKEIFPL